MSLKNKIYLMLLVASAMAQQAFSQSLPVGQLAGIDDYVRRLQLMGLVNDGSSLMVRPLFNDLINENGGPAKLWIKESGIALKDLNKTIVQNSSGTFMVSVLPVVTNQQFNSHHPYGVNDGLMIPSRGYQMTISGGFYLKAGPLSVQLRPEAVYAQNKKFTQSFEASNIPAMQAALRDYHGRIDAPERFGDGPYSRLDWGQSSIRLNFGPVSFGVSNENLWWGPGMRNSLLMTNNAPGFKHITINTTRPVKTPIGSFETQLIGGRLDGSGIPVPVGLKERDNDWRYLSGIVFVYQPKWVPGLFLGFDRSYSTYSKNLNGIADYLPLFSSLSKSSYQDYSTGINEEDARKRDQIFSLFAKWVMPESRSEIYFQYGREDHSWDLRDVFIEPEHSRAYVVGFNKLVPVNLEDNQFVHVGVEFTQMEMSGTKEVRDRAAWYQHATVRHGYTNKGQIIGAGAGPNNVQSLDIAWVKGLRRIGLFAERVVNNNGLYYDVYKGQKDPRRHWVDLGLGGKFDWDYKNFLFNTQLVYIRSFNYQYRFENQDPNYFWQWDKQDVNNLHFKVSALYAF